MRSLESTTRAVGGRRGFTLVELLVVVLIIGILVGILLVAVTHASSGVQAKAMQANVSSIARAVRQFEQTFGSPPPLVQDGLQADNGGAMTVDAAVLDRAGDLSAGTPVMVAPGNDRVRLVVTYNPAYGENRRLLEGLSQGGVTAPTPAQLAERYDPEDHEQAWRLANQRYSKYALGIYLAGAMPASVDGVDGPGMVRPNPDGTFDGVTAESAGEFETVGHSTSRERFEPFFDTERRSARLTREYFDLDEYRENAGDAGLAVADPTAQTDWRHAAITDTNGKAYRYYRWEPLSSAYGIATDATVQLNIPWVLLDDEALHKLKDDPNAAAEIDLTNGDTKLRSARWAVVGAGPDGVFGTEPIETLRDRLNLQGGKLDDWEVRAKAKADNAVEVGS
ncbi:MAG: prepilin-type N-terminal cleavage/methylation domain-containing protein [Phycisphaeraceae bacterium]|nr:MAG: prepilin-type N-terminal cleavage/methylation domain-containing protein [Phycisphaeraceae bacterium]